MPTRRSVILAAAAAPFVACAPKARTTRTLARVVDAAPHVDGAGVKLHKLLGSRALPLLDPFLMLDEFHSSNPADFEKGFPRHPHRGFETVTIMLDGHCSHEDTLGNHGDIAGGGVQWMTAGHGIVHAEMPRASESSGELWGYQLWVNLPARSKMIAPRYQDLTASAIPTTQVDDARVRILAGRAGNARGPVDGIVTQPTLLDVSLESGARLRHDVPAGHTAFVVVASGALQVGDQRVGAGQLGVLSAGDAVDLLASTQTRALLFAGAPIGEPVARRGPFVMNTDAELQQAFDDYRSGRLTTM